VQFGGSTSSDGCAGYGNVNANLAGVQVNNVEQLKVSFINNVKTFSFTVTLDGGGIIDAYVGQRYNGGNTMTKFTVNSILPPPTASPTSSPSSILPTYPVTKSPTTTPSTSTPSGVPSFSITASPSSAPTIIPYTALFVSKYLSFSGENFFAYSSLAQVLNSTFSLSAWITTNSHPASIVSLGRSSSSSSASSRGGEFILEINSNGKLNFKDFSPTTGPGFSVQGGTVVNSAGRELANLV
jgi:hypothetical protein